MIVPDVRPPAVKPAKRRYHSREERVAMVEDDLKHLTPEGRMPGSITRSIASRHGMCERQIRRAIVEAQMPAPAPRAWQAPRELMVRTAMYKGNLKSAYDEMRAEEKAGTGSWGLKSYPTAHRAVHRDPGLRLSLAKGLDSYKRFLLVGEFEADHRNELHYIDGMHLPMRCRDQYGRVVDDLWLISVFDAYSRLVIAHACVLGEPTAQITADVILATAVGRSVSIAEMAARGIVRPEDAFIGGAGDTLILDNALANKGELVREATTLAGVRQQFAEPMRPTDKAKLERFHWTLALQLAALPGYVRRSKDGGHDIMPHPLPPDHLLPRVEAVIEAVNQAVDDYNWHHVVSTTGSTPMARFLANETPIRPLRPIHAWPYMLVVGKYQVHPRGVKLPGGHRTVTHPEFRVGTTVEVRMLPGVPGRTFFGVDGRFCAEVKPHAALDEDEVLARTRQNGARMSTPRSVLKEAGTRLIADGIPDEVREAVARPAPRRRTDVPELVPDPRAALALAWQEPVAEEIA